MKEALKTDVDFDQPLLLDPFGLQPDWASAVQGLGGAVPAPAPGYVFHTLFCRPGLGDRAAMVRFYGLAPTSNASLLLEVRSRSAFPDAPSTVVSSYIVEIDQVLRDGGAIEVSFTSHPNAHYAIACTVAGPGAVTASHINVAIDRRATADEHDRDWGWRGEGGVALPRRPGIEHLLVERLIADLDVPTLTLPMSQAASPLQCREPTFFKAMQALGYDARPGFDSWAQAYIINAIARFSSPTPAPKILGCVADANAAGRLLSYYVGKGCESAAVQHVTEGDHGPDLGAALAELWVPELCEKADFRDHARFMTGDLRRAQVHLNDRFDVAWTIGVNRTMSAAQFVHFAANSLSFVKPGGLAVHVFDYVEDIEARMPSLLTRHDIERAVALAISHRNDVVQLRFRHGAALPSRQTALPFGLIMLRGGAATG